MAKNPFGNTTSTSKKKKTENDELFSRMSKLASQNLYGGSGNQATASRTNYESKVSRPTVPTVSSTVGSSLRDYGEFAGSRTEEEEELRNATLKDVTWNALKQGYYNALYGKESYKAMMGDENDRQVYEDILAGEDYQFAPDNWFEEAVSGAANLLGQQVSQWTDKRSLAAAGTAGTAAFIAGQAGPQVLVPEEVFTVPAAAMVGLKAGSATSNFEIEAGLAYNEMLENGVSPETAKKVALGIGGVNAGLELLQMDELVKSFKILKNSPATEAAADSLGKRLFDMGIDITKSVGKETVQEVAQEGSTIAGTQFATKHDTGEWAYDTSEVLGRLGDTAVSSALSFGFMNVPHATVGTYNAVRANQIGSNYSGDISALVDEGLQSDQNSESYQIASRLKTRLDNGEKVSNTEAYDLAVANQREINREASRRTVDNSSPVVESAVEENPVPSRMEVYRNRLAESGMEATEAETVATSIDRILSGDTSITNKDKDVLSVGKKEARAIFEEESGVKLPASNSSTRKAISDYIAQTAMKQQEQKTAAPVAEKQTPVNVMSTEAINQLKGNTFTVSANSAEATLRQAAEAAVSRSKANDTFAVQSNMTSLGNNGQRVYQKHLQNARSVSNYSNAFQRYYDAGQIGLPFESIKTAYDDAADRSALYEAYSAGQNDASAADKGKVTPKKKVAQKGKKMPSKGKGRFYDSRRSDSASVSKEVAKTLERFAKVFNVDIELVDSIADSKGRSIANGYYKDGKIVLAADSDNPLMTVLKHEVTHHLQKTSPKQYKELKDYVMKAFYENSQETMNAEIQRRIDLAHLNNMKLTRAEAMDEIVADATESFLTDRDSIDALVKENRSLAETILNAIRDVLKKIESAMKGENLKGYSDFMNADQLKKAEKMWVEALADAAKGGEIGVNYAEITESSAPVWSLKSMKFDLLDGQMQRDLVEHGIMTVEESQNLMDNISKLIDDMSLNAHILDVNEEYTKNDRPFEVYKPNSDPLYKVSLDFSTLCKKRLMTQFVMESLQTKLGKALSAKEQLAIRSKLEEYGKTNQQIQVACALCYVEARRLKAPDQINRFLDDRTTILTDYFGKKNKAYKASVDEMADRMKVDLGYKAETKLKNMKPADKKKINEAKQKMMKQYTPTAEEQKIIERANAIENKEFLSQAGLTNMSLNDPVIYDAFVTHVRNATKSKALESGVPYYYGDSKSVSDSLIEAMNAENGLRHQSWSDFEIVHLLDNIAAVIELSVRKAKMHAYTKVPDFVHVNGNTGIMINLSLIPAGKTGIKDGKLDFSPTEGMDFEVAVDLRGQYHKTAGTIAIGIDDQQIAMMLDDDTIDYVIPYHTSGMNAQLRKMAGISGWLDYESYQSEKEIKGAEQGNCPDELWHKKPDFSEWFDTSKLDMSKSGVEIMREAAGRYLVLCEERGLKPKFSDTKKHTDFSKHENYWKMLIDRKMVDGDGHIIIQQAVRPDFDFGKISEIVKAEVENYDPTLLDSINEMISAEWESGGIKQREKELLAEEKKAKKAKKNAAKVANGLLEQVVMPEGAQASMKDSDYMAAVERGDMETAQKMVDEAAKEAGYNSPKLYHGTSKFGFTKFDPSVSDDKISIFATSNNLVAETYSGKTNKYRVSEKSTVTPRDLDKASPDTILQLLRDNVDSNIEMVSDEEQIQIVEKHRGKISNAIRMASQLHLVTNLSGRSKEVIEKIVGHLKTMESADTYDAFMQSYNDYEAALWDLKWDDEKAGDILFEMVYDDVFSAYRGLTNHLGTTLYRGNSEYTKRNGKDTFNINEAISELHKTLFRGVYQLYAKLGKQFVVDADGANWNQIDGKAIGAESPVKTRDVAKFAKENDYDSVLFKNLRDSGDYTYMGTSDVYIFFDGNQVKSADPVTYDDNGNVIPLSERFNTENDDIRYSFKEADAAEERFGTTTDFEEAGFILPNGKMLKFTDDNRKGERTYDHRAIGLVYGVDVDLSKNQGFNFESSKYLNEFIENGGIRFEAGVPDLGQDIGLQLSSSVPLTREQEQIIRDLVEWKRDREERFEATATEEDLFLYRGSLAFHIDFSGGASDTNFARSGGANTLSYEGGNINADRIINDIRHYYRTGETRKPSAVAQFRYQLKTPEEMVDIASQIRHEAKAATDAEIMSQAIKDMKLTSEERTVIRNYQNAMKTLADYEKKLALYEATKAEHSKSRSIYTDASGKVKKSGVKYSAAERAEIQRKVEWWKRRLREIEQKEEFKKILKREKAKMAETHAKKMSDLRTKYNQRLDALRDQRDAKVEAEKQKMRDYKQHQRDSKEYKALKGKLEADVKWLDERLRHPTDAKHIPEDFKKGVAAFLKSLDFESEYTDRYEVRNGVPSQKVIDLRAMREVYENILKDQSSTMELDEIQLEALKELEKICANKRVADLDYAELGLVRDAIQYIKMSVASADKAFNKEIKESISAMGEALIKEQRGKKAKKDRAGIFGEGDKLINYDNVAPADKFHEFGGVMEKLYHQIRKGFDQHINNVQTAISYTQKLTEGNEAAIKEWSGDKAKTAKYKISDGTTIELTPAQVMSLYCLMKRDQAVGHVLGSGIVPSGVVVKEAKKFGKLKVNTAKKISAERASRCTIEDIQKIVETMTDEQKKIADGVMKLFTTKCADWGNETSMKLYGYKKFNEPNYFPIRSSDAYLNARFDDSGDVLIKNLGFTKNTVVNANNPIVVEDIFDVLADHVNKMSMYNALVVPLTDFTRVFNYKSKDADGTIYDSVQKALETSGGNLGIQYIKQFMKDVNKQANSLAAESFINQSISRYKKAKIAASARVLLQQPTAIARAGAMVDPKYLIKGLQQKANYKEMFDHSEIAYWKSLGFYQTDMGRNMKDILLDNETALDRLTMGMYGKADDFAWGHLWNAIKLEQADAHPDLDTTSSEFLDLVSERFEEVIDRTQVVDSVFHRSQIMRAQGAATKVATAFMAEPTKAFNLLRTDLIDSANSKDYSKFKRSVVTYVANAVLVSVFAGVADMIRDDEDEDDEGNKRNLWDKYRDATVENIVTNINPLGMIPYVKEVGSLFKGYDVSRMEMASIAEFVKTSKKWFSGKYAYPYLIKETAEDISELFGVPLKNVIRDMTALVRTAGDIVGGHYYADYVVDKMKYNISNSNNRSVFYKHYTDALLAGDDAAAEAILADMVINGIPYDNIVNKGYQKEKEVAFSEARKLIVKGKTDEAKKLIRELAKKYDKKYTTLWKAVKNGDSGSEPEEAYDFKDLQKAVRKGEDTELIEDYLTEYGGYSDEELEGAVRLLTEKYN